MNKRNFEMIRGMGLASAIVLTVIVGNASAQGDVATASRISKPIPALLVAHAEKSMLLGISRAGDQVVAVGGNGVIVKSADGKSWKQVKSPVDTALNAVAFADPANGWAVGHDAVILHTTDGGTTWAIQNFQPDLNAPIFSILALSTKKAIAVGAFGLIKVTEDGGSTWKDVDAPAISSEKLHLNSVTKLRNGKFAVAGEHGLVGLSEDGAQWSRLTTSYQGSFFGILPWGEKGAIAYGMRGNVFICDDVDIPSWKKIETSTISSFFGGEALDGGAVLLTGSENTTVTIQLNGTASPVKKIRSEGSTDSSLTGSLKGAASEIIIGDAGVVDGMTN